MNGIRDEVFRRIGKRLIRAMIDLEEGTRKDVSPDYLNSMISEEVGRGIHELHRLRHAD